VIVHVWPEQEKAGKMVLPPIVLPCVLDVAVLTLSIYNAMTIIHTPAMRDTLIFAVVPWNN
jgi:hypothetical protein